jgi:hypothetical protein
VCPFAHPEFHTAILEHLRHEGQLFEGSVLVKGRQNLSGGTNYDPITDLQIQRLANVLATHARTRLFACRLHFLHTVALAAIMILPSDSQMIYSKLDELASVPHKDFIAVCGVGVRSTDGLLPTKDLPAWGGPSMWAIFAQARRGGG